MLQIALANFVEELLDLAVKDPEALDRAVRAAQMTSARMIAEGMRQAEEETRA
jgi:hypothetical protein